MHKDVEQRDQRGGEGVVTSKKGPIWKNVRDNGRERVERNAGV